MTDPSPGDSWDRRSIGCVAQDATPEFVLGGYHQPWQIEHSFRCPSPTCWPADLPPQRDSIEAHPTIVFAALAVRGWLERQTGWSIKKLDQPSAATAASRSARASTFSTPTVGRRQGWSSPLHSGRRWMRQRPA
jgi:hypothetical protein